MVDERRAGWTTGCLVCERPFGDDPGALHIFHNVRCLARLTGNSGDCDGLGCCGDDVHPECCPTCHP